MLAGRFLPQHAHLGADAQLLPHFGDLVEVGRFLLRPLPLLLCLVLRVLNDLGDLLVDVLHLLLEVANSPLQVLLLLHCRDRAPVQLPKGQPQDDQVKHYFVESFNAFLEQDFSFVLCVLPSVDCLQNAQVDPMLKREGSAAQPKEDACELGAQFFLLLALDVAEHGPREGPYEHGEYFLEGEHQAIISQLKIILPVCFRTYITLMCANELSCWLLLCEICFDDKSFLSLVIALLLY